MMHMRLSGLSQTKIQRTGKMSNGLQCRGHFKGIPWRHNCHVWQTPHHRNVFQCMVCGSHVSVTVSRPNTDDAHGKVVIAHVVSDLFQTSVCRKWNDRVDKDPSSRKCETSRYGNHVLFCNPY